MSKLFKPREIAEQGLIKNSLNTDNVTQNYQFVLKEIKAGRLKAKNYGTKSRQFWRVSEAEIKRYLQEVDN